MTAWQDLPPQTRRQARMNQRGAQPDAASERAEFEPDIVPAGEQHQDIPAPSRRARRARDSSESEQSGVEPATPVPNFRVRDFRPEANVHAHAAFPTTIPDASKASQPTRQLPQWSPSAVEHDGELSYFTQAAPVQAPQQAVPPALVSHVPAEYAAPPQPLTRRQLRELETSQGIRPQADDAPPAPASAEPIVEPPIVQPIVRLAPPVAVPLPVATPPIPTPPAVSLSEAPPPLVSPPSLVSPEPIVFTDAPVAPFARVAVAPVPVATPAPRPIADSVAARRGIDLAPEVYTAPGEQWAVPQTDEIGHHPGAGFVSTLGTHTGILTTSALVIPSVPTASDITRPFSSTGEILVTGSIDLPHTLGTTGAHPARFDHSDIDALFAAEDHDFAPADSAPVRAIRAVSTHTSTHGVISAKKPANNRLPMMMAVTAGILAVGVAALFAAGMIFGYF